MKGVKVKKEQEGTCLTKVIMESMKKKIKQKKLVKITKIYQLLPLEIQY